MLKHRSVLLGKLEATYNTDPVPTGAANAILVENLAFAWSDSRMAERPVVRTVQGKLKPLFGGTLATITFDVEVKGSGTAGTAPEIGALLRASSFSETIVASTSVAYTLVSTAQESMTFYFFMDGKRYVMTGAIGTKTADLSVGSYGKFSFSFTGHTAQATDVALATPTYSSQIPPVLVSVPFTIDTYSAVISGLKYDTGVQIAKPPSITAADGYGRMTVTGRNVTGSIDPEDVLIATHDFEARWRAGTAMALTTGVIGATAGNRYTISMPSVVYNDAPTMGDRDGIATLDMKFLAQALTTDNELTITFT